MSTAYIITDRQNEYVQWQYTENQSEIIHAPFDGLIFIPEGNDKASTIPLLIATMNYPPLILNNLKIFDYVQADYHLKTIKFFTNPSIDHRNLYYHKEELKNYIIESQKPFQYSYIDNDFKKELNKLGIYVRPTKKIFEYNPKKAKIQLTRLTKPKKRSAYVKYDNLATLATRLRKIIFYTTKMWVITHRQHTKRIYSDEIMILADLYNMIFKKNSYREFKAFKEVVALWKTTTDKKIYSKNFIKWMDYESSLKPRKKTNDKLNLKPKTVFKISNIDEIT